MFPIISYSISEDKNKKPIELRIIHYFSNYLRKSLKLL